MTPSFPDDDPLPAEPPFPMRPGGEPPVAKPPTPGQRLSQGAPPDDALDFGDVHPIVSRRELARRRKSPQGVIFAVGAALVVVVGGVIAYLAVRPKQSLELAPMRNLAVAQGQKVEATAKATYKGGSPAQVKYSFVGELPEATIDARTGRFSWTPSESVRLGTYPVTVRATTESGLSAQQSFRIKVQPAGTLSGDGATAFEDVASDSGSKRGASKPSKPDISPPRDRPLPGAPSSSPPAEPPKPPKEKPAEAVKQPVAEKEPAKTAPQDTREAEEARSNQAILELFRKNRLLVRQEYPKLRNIFAERFEKAHAAAITQAFGEPGSEFRRWIEERPNLKEEFFLAIDPAHDDVPKALAMFRTLWEKFPARFEAYGNLAIAVSVVWDRPAGAIHDSPTGQHHSLPPQDGLDGPTNFQYFLEAERAMQGRAQYLPWEFLVHIVNHRTTAAERQWAVARYAGRASMIGKVYSDVPYDGAMLRGIDPRLSDKPHTLANQLALGGVCTCQADFAARVAKSIGVPAFSATSPSKFGEGHAWVMWVELGQVTRTGFTFTLQSHGRYRDDNYYVGNLNDPHTGRPITDRQMELRLHAVGMDPLAKRHMDLVMRCWPLVRDDKEMDAARQLQFLSHVIENSPGNEEAWKTVAALAREKQITKAHAKLMAKVFDSLFKTFGNFPDFTWSVFDDMTSYEERPKQRILWYARLVALYEAAKRVDLACEAQIKLAELLLADQRSKDAVDALATAILKYADEGRYVPRMLDKLEELCRDNPKLQEALLGFYQQFLPKIPQRRGDAPSPYCMKMYERAISRFTEAGAVQLAQNVQRQLQSLEASKPRKQ